jgi:hypothetical protein
MGIAKRSLSPLFDPEDDSSEDAMFPRSSEVVTVAGQMDIRNFCTMFASHSQGFPAKVLRGEVCLSPDDELPLVKLPGQMDIRSFFRCESDEQAARAMGLSLGLENDEDDGDEFNVIAAEVLEVTKAQDHWSMALDAAEEAAVSMGLSMGMLSDMEDIVEDMADDIMVSKLREQFEAASAARMDTYEVDEEAAREMGLSLSLDDDSNNTGHIDKKLRLNDDHTLDAHCPAPATPPKRGVPEDEKVTPLHNAKRVRVAKETAEEAELSKVGSKCARKPSGLEADAKGVTS